VPQWSRPWNGRMTGIARADGDRAARAAMEPTVERSDDGSVFSGRLTWDDARSCERHGNQRFRSLTFVLSRSEKH
jgi:hypothetical protein